MSTNSLRRMAAQAQSAEMAGYLIHASVHRQLYGAYDVDVVCAHSTARCHSALISHAMAPN